MKLVSFLALVVMLLGAGTLLAGCRATDTKAASGATAVAPAAASLNYLPQDG